LDYAASANGIKDYKNPWGIVPLGLGGNFIYATTLMANGLTLVDNNYMPYVETLNEKPLHEIHNYSNSLYEVNSTVNLPNFGRIELDYSDECMDYDDFETCYNEKSEELFQEYINTIKKGIMNYGGIYVAAYDPTGECGAVNVDGKYVLDPNDTCFPIGSTISAETGHAMQIIGWDDEYEYTYCKDEQHTSTIDGKCNSGKLTQGKGAWLVKNSWGENDAAAYIYLTYDAIKSNKLEFAYITSLTEMKEKTWDNVYNNGIVNYSFTKKLTQTFEKKFNNQEKIQKIKFHTILMNDQYSITIKIDGHTYFITDSFQTEYPGLYTVDLTDQNIFIESGKFDVIISGSKRSINDNSISVFTKNVDNKQLILTEEEKNVDSNKFTIYSETRNISSNSQIMYELYADNEKLDNVLQVKNNIVSANNINAEISITKKIDPGVYRLVQKYNGIEATTYLNIGNILEGDGTADNPYKIYTEEDLKHIYNHLDSYFELEKDIELTKEWIPIGTIEKPFTGGFDGNNHKILNLKIDDSTLEYAGLFGYIKDSEEHKTYIKNIYLVNSNILGKQYVGGLIGGININQTGENIALIDSIYIIGGNIDGQFASGLVADISGTKELIINNIFSSATINGKTSSSLIRFSSNNYDSNNGTSITNIENVGVMLDNNLVNYQTSLINAKYSYYYNISKYISTGYSKKVSINQFYDTPVHNIHYNYLSNGYVLSRADSTYEFPSNIQKVSNIVELKNLDNYSEWGEDFNSYWKIEEKDGIKRIPMLKSVDLDYTDCINNISVEFGNSISLSDYFESELITRRLKVTTEDDEIIKISEKYYNSDVYPYEIILSPLKSGTATIHLISDYDGFEKDITITVFKTELKITYYNDSDKLVQTIANGSTANLIKNTFTKEWHTFIGWNTKSDGTGTFYRNEQEVTITDDLDLYAQWERNTVRISFDANGGTGYMEDIVVPVSDYMVTQVPDYKFVKEGYKATSWNTEPDGSGKSYRYGGIITPAENIILYVQWEPKYYDVKYHYSFKDLQESIQTSLFVYDNEYELMAAYHNEEGYKFAYWGTKADGSGINYLANQKVKNLSSGTAVNLYTVYEPINYKLLFNSNDGNDEIVEQIVTYDKEEKLLNNLFIREGYIFKEWNTNPDGSDVSYKDEQSVKNLTSKDNVIINLYAIWEKAEYTVTFDSNEGIFKDNKTTIVIDKWENSKLESLEKPTRRGYTFKGYYTAKTGGTSLENYISEAGIDQDGLVFYARWEPIKYTVTFNANEGTNNKITQKIEYGIITPLLDNTFTRDGFKFVGWNTKDDGTGIFYSNSQKVSVTEDLNLFAIWEETYSYIINKYSIDKSSKYIDLIDPYTTVDYFKKNIKINSGYSVDVDYKSIGGKNILYTGGKTRIYKNNVLYSEYTNIIRGDVNGNATIDIIDYIRIMKHIMEEIVLKNEVYKAADVNQNGKIDIIDYIRIMKMIMEEN